MKKKPARGESVHRAIAGLQQLSELFEERRQQLAREAGLSVAQWRVLEEIEQESFMPSLFARRRAKTAAAISKTLRPLIERDLVRVSVSATDGRQRDYVLSPSGRRALARLVRSRERAIDAIWGDLEPSDLDRFAHFAERLSARLEAYINS
jgi:DNA-binding MarR family transcriptional regulator